MASDIRVQRRGDGRAVVSIVRPHRRNACDFAAWTDLKSAFESLGADPAVKLVVLTGEGGHFCAGDDVIAFGEVKDESRRDEWRVRIQECYAALQSMPKPVIAAISGVCVGGGCSLAMCCDFRVGDRSARVGVPVAKIGLVYPTVQLQRLAWLVGASTARRWIYEARLYEAQVARGVGFLDELGDGDVVDAALEFGRHMAAAAPLSIAGSKAQLNAILAGRVNEERLALDAMVRRADTSEDFREASAAFKEKREPVFRGH